MTALKPSKNRQRGRWQKLAVLAAALGIVLGLGVAAPASAAIQTGTLGCGGNYGWLTATAYVYSTHVPPGGQKRFISWPIASGDRPPARLRSPPGDLI